MDEQSMQFSESVLNRLSKRHLARDVGGDKIFLRFPLGCNDCFLPDWGHKVKIRGFEILYIRSKCLFSKGRCPRPRGGLHMCVRVIICLILQTCHWHFPFAINLFCQSDNPDSQRKECELHTCLFSAAARCEYHGWRSFCTFVFFFFWHLWISHFLPELTHTQWYVLWCVCKVNWGSRSVGIWEK